MKLSAVLNFLNISENWPSIELSNITIDSRVVQPGSLFVAIPGHKTDGRQYISQALAYGAAAILVADTTVEALHNKDANFPQVPIINVPNLAARLPLLAAYFYNNASQHLQIIGVTGTNGKTSITNYIAQILGTANTSCGIMGTLGNGTFGKLQPSGLTTSDACTVQKQFAQFVEDGVKVVAMEVSSHALAQGRLTGTKFNTAVFTNLTQDHLDYHGNMQDYFASKALLFQEYNPNYCVVNLDDQYGQSLIKLLDKNTTQVFTYSLSDNSADIYLTDNKLYTPWGNGNLHSPLIGSFNRSNLLACIACCALQGMALVDILSAITTLKSVPGRMQIVNAASNEPLVVVDYAHTPDALVQALKALREHASNAKAKIHCVFGCGGDRDRSKRSLMLDAVIAHSDFVIITQDNPRTEDPQQIINDMLNGRAFGSQVSIVLDRADAILASIKQAEPQDLILIAGKGHEDYQIIGTQKFPFSDFASAQHALATIRSKTAWAI